MRKEAYIEQWQELYEIAIKIKELKPWEHLWDMDTITLSLAEKDSVLCSVMGRGGEFYGIGAYIGDNAISNFFTMLEEEDIPPDQMVRYQDDNIIMCNFGSRDELTSKELKLIKELGFKFRGKNNWIYFQSYKKGYTPYMLDQEEVEQAIEIFQNLYMSLRAYIEEGLEVDFENGHTLMRVYKPEEELWINFGTPLLIPESNYVIPILKDEILIKRISKLKQNKGIWQFDISYLNVIVNDKEYDRPANGRICIIADKASGLMINQNMISPTDDDLQTVFDVIIPSFMDYGRPQKILVRDEYLYYILKDFCERTKVKLEIKGRLDAIDSFLMEFASFR